MPVASPTAHNGTARIEAKGLRKDYGRRSVVQDVNLSVDAGEIVGLLGPNGAGKTTSFYMIVGLVAATHGQVFLNQDEITRLPMYQRARLGIGYLPQEESAFRKLTVEDNLAAIAETLRLRPNARKKWVDRLLEELGLEDRRKQKAFTLSGGERRRLEIARALVTSPQFLLLDEPFSGVDPISVSEVKNIVVSLKRRGIGILITDHNVRETLSIVDRAYLLHEGRVLVEGDSDYLLKSEDARRVYLGHDFNL
ncbi:MAG: lipopolysaccharide export system ATP-binding protein [Puniceicoccaceae bacterium 5H]|nr:MAG: lipopolysaccharide export system ATP-binding protein [Puniceicoccaceae bacterium 5H]